MNTLLDEECPAEAKEFLNSFDDAQKTVGLRVVLGRMSFLVRDAKFQENCTLIRSYTRRHVDHALALQKERGGIAGEKNRKYVLVHELAKESQDLNVLCEELLNVFFAGRDAPAVALSNVFFCIARQSATWGKIRKEVERFRVEDLSFEKLKGLKYTQYAINEGK